MTGTCRQARLIEVQPSLRSMQGSIGRAITDREAQAMTVAIGTRPQAAATEKGWERSRKWLGDGKGSVSTDGLPSNREHHSIPPPSSGAPPFSRR